MEDRQADKPISALLIEDSPSDVLLIRTALGASDAAASHRPSFDLVCTNRLVAGLALLETGQFQVVLLDLSLPDSKGLETFRAVREKAAGVPVVILTGLNDELLAMKTLQEGAQDYLVKGQVNGDSIRRVTRYAIERARQEEALRQAHEELEVRVQEKTADLLLSNEALKRHIAEKEILLKEIHHRVKNNLQIISSLLTLQAHHLKDGKPPLEVIQESQLRIQSMALIHDKLYQSQNLSEIDAREYVRTLAENLFHTYGINAAEIELTIQAPEPVLWITEIAVPCGLIVHELMSNALKHAFPPGRPGRLRISLSCARGHCTLIVSDDGCGLPPHVDFRHTQSLGLQLVVSLTSQLGGTIEMDGQRGTTVTVTFPLPSA